MAKDCYRVWRSRLYSRWKLYKTDEERLENPPKNVSTKNWEYLVKYFGTPKFQVCCYHNFH